MRATLARARAPPPPPTPLPERDDLSDLGDLRVSLESSGTFLGMSDELLLERVRTQPIVRFKFNHGGSSISFRVEFADGSRAAWKPTQTNTQTIPRKEIAAYRLNRLLGLNAVPPAAPRAVSREELLSHLHPESLEFLPRIKAETIFNPSGISYGTASYWIPVIKDSGFDTPEGQRLSTAWLTVGGETIPPDRMAFARADLRPHPVRLPDLQPRPLLGREHEDVGRRDRALLHGQHDVVLRRPERDREEPRGAARGRSASRGSSTSRSIG